MRARWTALPALVLALLLLITGCVSVPTSGQPERVSQGGGVPENEPEVVPNPPVQDGSPREILDGFLLAMTRYEANYKTARLFLTDEAAQSWRPEDRVTVFTEPTYGTSDDNVTLQMTRVGQVDNDGSYTAQSGRFDHDFQMVQDSGGQWRVSNPPNGLLISDSSFSANFTPYNLYFFDPQFRTLVPDPVYLPSDGQTESALVQALLSGPTAALRTAVSTTFPPRTALVGNAVTVENDLAQIRLSPQVQSLDSQQRIRMATQLAWTLRQVDDGTLRGLQVTVNSAPLRIPRQIGQGESAYVPISFGSDFDPVPSGLQDPLVGVQDDRVVLIGNDGASISPIRGQLGQPGYGLESLALSADARSLAAVTNDRTTLATQSMSGGELRTRLTEHQQLLRPDYSRYDELWAISGKPGEQQIETVDDDKINTIDAPWLDRVQVRRFRISPDGSRIAMIISTGQRQLLAIAPIQRGNRVRLGTAEPIQLVDSASVEVTRLADLGWVSSTRLLILGASVSGASYEPYGVDIDGSQFERVGTSDDWGATGLATQAESGGAFRAVVAGRGDRMWAYRSGDSWEQLTDNVSEPAYPN